VNRHPQHELFSPERPVYSEFPRDKTYTRRRIFTVLVLILALGGVGYALWGGSDEPPDPSSIPTVKADESYKLQPDDPGGIDIPHQDVRVYQQLEGKGVAVPKVEHLLPASEEPKDLPQADKSDAVSADAAPTNLIDSAQEARPVATTIAAQPSTTGEAAVSEPAPKVVAPVSIPVPAPVPPVAAPVKVPAPVKLAAPDRVESQTIDKVIGKVNAETSSSSSSSEKVFLQIASISDETRAKDEVGILQKKYASELEGSSLRLVRADLGTRGIFYRIQSGPFSRDDASRICSALKKAKAGCILVGNK